ncbi:MAG: hypothetical protein WAV16_03985 [Candidatus Moraniibacteriota bacterium]
MEQKRSNQFNLIQKSKKYFVKSTQLFAVGVFFVFLSLFLVLNAKAKPFDKEITIEKIYVNGKAQLVDGQRYVVSIFNKIKDRDISNNADIAYKKLNLKNSIKSSDIKDGAITSAKLANGIVIQATILDGSITSGKIADGAVVTIKLADGAVTTAKIEDGAITGIKLADNSVTTAKLQGLSVTSAILADGSVTDVKILDATISGGKLQDGAITTIKLADDSVTTGKIVDGTILAADLMDGIITTLKLADDSVITAKILDGSITSGKIADGAVVTIKLADGAVTTAKIEDGAITELKLADNSVITAKILDAAVTVSKLADDSVITSKILDAAITNGKIADSAINPAKLADQAVINSKLAADAVTSDKILDGVILGNDLATDISINTSGVFTAPTFVGDLTGNVTGDLTGNADTVTNGVYTTGAYADPSWITSLDGSKIVGAVAATIADGAITNIKLAADAVTSDKILDGTITGADLATDINVTTTGTFTAPTFVGDLTGNVTGDVTGNVTGDVTGDVVGNVTGNLTGNADTVTDGVYITSSYADPSWITSLAGAKITGVVADATNAVNATLAATANMANDIVDGAITNIKLAADAVTSDKILDGTITGADLATDIDVTTTGDIQSQNLTATSITDGTATLNNGDISSTSHTMNIEVAADATDSDVFITNTGAGKANLYVEGNMTGGSLGTSGSRWSTIYADTVNFLSGLTNSDNTAGPDSTINLGTAGSDSAEIHIGNSGANISLTDADWSIAGDGKAEFLSIGDINPGTATFTTLITSGNATLDSLDVDNNLTVGGNVTTTGTVTIGNQLLVSSGGIDITGAADFRNDLDLHSHDINNVDNLTATGSITGSFEASGSMDMNSHDINNVDNLNASGIISGQVESSNGHNSDITVKGSDGNDCDINISHGIVTGTTCP